MLPATSWGSILNPRFLNQTASYDVADNIRQAIPPGVTDVTRHDIDTHFEPSFLESNGISMTWRATSGSRTACSSSDNDGSSGATSYSLGHRSEPASQRSRWMKASVASSFHSCAAARNQGLTLVPISAQLELFCPPYNPT
jgi:hypothetical protein